MHRIARRRLVAALGVCLLLFGAPLSARAQDSDAAIAARLRDAALKDEWGYRFVETLTTEIGQRLAGTPSEARAAIWAEKTLKAAGFDEVQRESFPITAWLRGEEDAAVVTPAPQHLVVTALGGSIATPKQGVTAEIALFRRYSDLLAAPAGSLAGKIAVVTQRMPRVMDGSAYGAANPIRRLGPSEAAKRGAIAYLLRSLGTDDHRLAHTGATNYEAGAPRIPAAALSNPDADQLERLAARGKVTVHLVLTPRSEESAQSWTVSAQLNGSARPDEIVLIGAHLDSWDLGTGAIDDGAGDAIVAGAAHLVAQLHPRPKRSLRVVLFGAEEMDYSGPAYAKAHAAEVPHIVLAAESDFGARKIYAWLKPLGSDKTGFVATLGDALTPLGIFLAPEPALRAGDDIAPLRKLGVPVIAMRQNGLDYFDIHHTADDTFDKIDRAELDQNIAAWAAMAYLAAQSDLDFRKLAADAQR
ncbi:MAG TPA: M28 family peptidase [Stellaceae bacterium]|nr:M28 family peptidase [Stellaceae bacterium]